MFIMQIWRKALHSGTICSIQSACKRNNNAPGQTIYPIFLEFWSQSVCFLQLAPVLKPWTCNKIGLITSIPAPCLNISHKAFLLPLWCHSSWGFMESLSIPYTQSKHMCPGYSQDLLFCLGYANEQIQTLFSSFILFFFSDLVLSLSSILSASLPSSASEPRMTLARFPAFLFLCLSSCYSPSRSVCSVQMHSVFFLQLTSIKVTFLIGCPVSANQSSKRETDGWQKRNNGFNCLHFRKIINFFLIPWITVKVFGVSKEKHK